MHVRCPYCLTAIDLTDDSPLGAILCSSCGSSFSLVGEETMSYHGVELKTVGRFELIEQVGMGGFGAVWKARDPELDRTIAIKIPRKGQLSTAEIEQFLREARAAAQLQHPNIISVHEVGRDAETVYIVSDFVRGATLDSWLERRRLTPSEGAELTAKIADALHHAHQAGVIHRDLKPGNVMIDSDGEPHLMDFGLARREAGEVTMTVDGRVLGTPAYMSPEQARGEAHQADRRTDIYSLGVLLFRILTGELPFRGNRDMLILQIINEDPPSPRRLNGRVPRDLETICLKCIEKTPERRYESAAEVAQDLRRWLYGEPIAAKPAGLFGRTVKWVRRCPAVAALVAVSFVAGLALVGVGIGFLYNLQLQQAFHQVDVARDDAEDALHQAQSYLYFQRVGQADREWWANHVGQAEQLLEECPSELRGWEWYYLKRLCHANLRTFRGHTGQVNCVAYSPDGQHIASGAFDGTVRVWRTQDGRQLHTLRSSVRDWIWDLAYSPDGSLLASAVMTDADPGAPARVTLWEPTSGRELRSIQTRLPVMAVAFSRDKQLLAWATMDGVVSVWDLKVGQELRTLEHTDIVGCLAFSPDARYIACGVGSPDPRAAVKPGSVKLWDVKTGEEYRTLQGHTAPVAGIAFSPDGKWLASSSWDQTIKIWSPTTGDGIVTLRGHAKAVDGVTYSPDGSRIASASADGSLKVWDASTGRELLTLRGHAAPVTSVVFSPDGQRIVSASDDQTLRLWDANRSQVMRVLHAPTQGFAGVAFSPVQKWLASSSLDGSVQIWDLLSGRELKSFQAHTARAWTISFSPDGRRVATASEDLTVKVWDATSGALVSTCTGHERWVQSAVFSPNGKFVASAGGDTTVKLWDPNTGAEVRTLRGHTNRVWHVAFTSDSQFLASAGGDKLVRVWATGTGEELQRVGEHSDEVTSVAFTPDAELLAAGCTDGTVTLWQLRSGERVHTWRGHAGTVYALAFSPDGQRLASASHDTSVKLWDTRTGEDVLTLRGHSATVMGVAFSPDGNQIATASMDQTIGLWDATPLALDQPNTD